MLQLIVNTYLINEFISIYSKHKDLLSSLTNDNIRDSVHFSENELEISGFKISYTNREIIFYFDQYDHCSGGIFLDKLSAILLEILEKEYIFNYSYKFGIMG